MTIFTKLGRALLLAAAVAVGALWIAGCGGDSGTNNGNGDGGGSNNGVVDPSEVVRGTFTDSRDGQTYKTVKIGRQRWTAENLNIETADSRCYNDSPDSCAKYGRMYTWAAAKTACPTGWHLPSRDEWNNLETAAGGSLSAGKKLKSTNGWYNNGNGTDDYGFSALPGGGFGNAGSYGSWWTASENGGDYAYYRYMGNYDDLRERNDYKSSVFSVRCVED